MKKSYLFGLLLLTLPFMADAQTNSPYQLNTRVDLPAVGIGITYPILSHYVWEPKIKPLTNTQLLALDPLRINAFDRPATQNHSILARKASDFLLIGSTVLPLILLSDKNMRADATTIGTMYAQTFLANYMVTDIVKKTVLRTRPLAYNASFGEERFERDTRMSFFSGHTSSVAASTFFTAAVWQKYHPDSKLSPIVWATAATIPAITGYSRYRAGKHFPTDIIVGYLVGAGIGLLVPHLHAKNN